MSSILDSLPAIYRMILPSLSVSVPEETKATCSNCAMCASNQDSKIEPSPEQIFFEPNLKCCTFHPNLPNYLVGALLQDSTEERAHGRGLVLDKIKSHTGSTPFGVAAPAKYALMYSSTREFFGRSKTMLCPYYVDEGGGMCSIWNYREAVCSTYFCKHVAGADGRRMWMSLKSFLALVEHHLCRYAIYQLYPEYLVQQKHIPDPPARKLEREELESGAFSTKTYEELWSNWAGMEEEFFKECYRIVSEVTPEKLLEIMGLDGTISEATFKNGVNDVVAPKLPEKLRLNPNVNVKWLPNEEVIMSAYSELDALALPAQAYQLVQKFRGDQTVANTRAQIRKDMQSDFSDEVLLSLYQYRILESC